MKQASNIVSLTITGIAVKTYMRVSITWSKSNELYKTLQSEAKHSLASKLPRSTQTA